MGLPILFSLMCTNSFIVDSGDTFFYSRSPFLFSICKTFKTSQKKINNPLAEKKLIYREIVPFFPGKKAKNFPLDDP